MRNPNHIRSTGPVLGDTARLNAMVFCVTIDDLFSLFAAENVMRGARSTPVRPLCTLPVRVGYEEKCFLLWQWFCCRFDAYFG